jgi:hypothetical protein
LTEPVKNPIIFYIISVRYKYEAGKEKYNKNNLYRWLERRIRTSEKSYDRNAFLSLLVYIFE